MKIFRNVHYLMSALSMCCALSACDNQPSVEPIKPQSEPELTNKTSQKNHDAEVINFAGFGPAKFGGNEESVRMSWGRPLNASKPVAGATCYYLYLDPKPEPQQEIAFMLEDGQFVRYDVDHPKWIAPGNIVVGDTMTKVVQAHAGRIENQPHKYIEGAHTLIVTPTEVESDNKLSSTRLIFETDANDIVINWRIGVAPQVYYVEGCN
ncbi:MAG: hypothetical protein V4570_03935 [Pseudomonadota bacterium]